MNLTSKLYYANRRVVKFLRLLALIAGPGILVMVADNDAGGITTYTATGAKYGYGLIWFLVSGSDRLFRSGVDQMTTGQAADVLSVLSASEANEIVKLLDQENAVKIRAIMEHHEEKILDFATQEYVSFPPDYTVERAQDEYRTVAKGKDVVMYR